MKPDKPRQLGVVIRPAADFQCRSIKERSSVEEVYALVVSGLTKAYSDLPAKIVFMPINTLLLHF
jgi:hypothetical protein